MKCCKSKKCCSKENMPIFIIVGLIVIVLKVFALIDLFKKRKNYSKTKKTILTLLILIFPPAPLIYLIVVNVQKSDDDNKNVNMNKEGLL